MTALKPGDARSGVDEMALWLVACDLAAGQTLLHSGLHAVEGDEDFVPKAGLGRGSLQTAERKSVQVS